MALIRSFFVAMNSSDMRNWCQQTLGRFQDLVSFMGDRLFGPTNPISEQRGARGRAPPTSSRLWQMYARIDKPLTDVTSEAPTAAGIPGLCSLDPSPAPHLSRLQSDWLSLLCTTGAFSRPQDGYNEHFSGQALDVMIPNWSSPGGKAYGDSVAKYMLSNASALGIDYILWQQRQWNADGTSSAMGDRGDPTQNHMDHIHAHTVKTPDLPGATAPRTD